MSEKRDYYEVLEVGRQATADDLRRAYRRLAKQVHPDVNHSPGAEERFKELNEAYAVLSDEERRSAYDRYGHAGVQGLPTDFGFGFSDIFEEFFGFGMASGRARRRAPRRGADLRLDVTIAFEEAVFGVERELAFHRHEPCQSCGGTRAEPGTCPVRCSTCNGTGEVRQVRQTFLGSMVNVTTCPQCRGAPPSAPRAVSPIATSGPRHIASRTTHASIELSRLAISEPQPIISSPASQQSAAARASVLRRTRPRPELSSKKRLP